MTVPSPAKTLADVPASSVRLLNKPDFMDSVVAEVANGGSLLDLVKRLGVPYEHATRWIYCDPVRKDTYQGAIATRAEWYVQGIMRELRDLAFVDIAAAFDETTGRLKDITDIPENVRRNIAGFEVIEQWDKDGNKTGELKKIKMADKRGSIELLMKHLKMFVEEKHVVVSGSVTHTVDSFDLEERIAQLRKPKPVGPAIDASVENAEVRTINKPGDDI